MKFSQVIILVFSLVSVCSCTQTSEKEATKFTYFNRSQTDTIAKEPLIAVTDEEYLQYGARLAYLNTKGDTIIPFGKYAYLGTDTLTHYANVIAFPKDSAYGKWIAIDRNQNTLYDIVFFDNGPDYFHNGLVRVKRNGKIGYADKAGCIKIPCVYECAYPFENGKAKVTYHCKEAKDDGGHTTAESEA